MHDYHIYFTPMSDSSTAAPPAHFIRKIIAADIEAGTHDGKVHTRFPPEPNGYLHIGHAKSICLNFSMAEEFGGACNLRFDDTNPEKEEGEFVEAIKEDIQWLGYTWQEPVHFASDYFQQLYEWALHLIREGNAYVCHLTAEEAREYRGTLTEPGRNSPHRDRSVDENLALFEKMKSGELVEGECVLRAKIDMASPNINLRDPIIYRIRHVSHHQTGDAWKIYPTYDFTHGQSDAIEGITHSICTLEFEDHRPLYEWFLAHLPVPCVPRQYEFARLNINYTVTSKRKLKQLVDENHVSGWNDPRMPTISGMRRRGYSPAALRQFCDMVGVTRSDGVVDVSMLEFAVRDDLNRNAARAMCVIDPVKVVIENLEEGAVEILNAPVHPDDESRGERSLPFTRELYIDRADFSEDTTLSRKKFKRLVLGEWIRLRNAYVIQAKDVVKDADGNITEIRAELVPDTLGKNPPEGIKPRGVIHWVSATEGRQVELRMYERLFNHESPDAGGENFLDHVNPESLSVVTTAWVEPGLVSVAPEEVFQFEREGYFVADRYDHSESTPVFNKTIGLKDGFAKG
jgi:glutaminyl-tRNA synthetase